MTDEYNKEDKRSETDKFFDEFDKISQEFDKTQEANPALPSSSGMDKNDDPVENLENQGVSKTRMERLSESKNHGIFTSINGKADYIKGNFLNSIGKNKDSEASDGEIPMTKKKKKKYTVNKKQLFKFIVCAFLAIALVFGGIVVSIIVTAPPIDTDNIYSLLAENSILYDDEGNIIDSLLTNDALSDGLRTNVSYSDMPTHLVDAFIAIEDKTFWTHNGFNIIRIFGAIKESVFEGGSISGTSTITQQLARNLYLAETKSDYSITRKIKEAYYAVLLEKHLSKEQIIEAYLNTISLGFGTNGVQAASQAYFSKDVADLTLAESASLATIPKSPGKFALLKRFESDQVGEDNENIITRGDTYTIVYNDASTERKKLVLTFMKGQGLISESEYSDALAQDLKASMNPSEDALKDMSSYFADYAINDVIKGLMKELDIEESEARRMVDNNGLRIYTTLNTKMQKIAETEFSNNGNFPKVVGLDKDGSGNILNSNGSILLYSYASYFNAEGTFQLNADEYKTDDQGNIILFKGKRLNFYKTEVQGQVDYSIEFKDMYLIEEGIFYGIKGGVINVPQQYKDRDEDGNLIIKGAFFEEKPDFFQFGDTGLSLAKAHYSLKQKVVQPQSAMVIFEYKTGGIKAMVGGRNIEGRLLFNRATSPRQPGSSIKPMGVYGPALQSGVSNMKAGIVNSDSEGNSFGKLWTAASVVDDAPMTYQGKLWPKNWYNGYRGLTTLRQSVEQSVNTNAVRVFTELGVSNSVNFLKKLGVTTIQESGDVNDMNAAALALGGMSRGISPLEMVVAYGTFANQGNYTEPVSYTKVTNKRGEVILESAPQSTSVMDKGVAFIMTDILRTTVSNGIAGSASIGSHPVAGKTGTTTDNYDAWFVGYTPHYAASVWIGNDVNIELSTGSVSASRLWSKIMKQVHSGLPSASFPSADNVISLAIDTKSGRLPSELSALDPNGTVRNEYFVKGTEPTTIDNVHTSITVCAESNYLATPYCPNPTAKVVVKRPNGLVENVADNDQGGTIYYCHLHNFDPTTYPINPSESLNPDYNWDGSGGEDGGIIPINPDDPNPPGTNNGNGNNGNNNGNDNGNKPPDWLNFLN